MPFMSFGPAASREREYLFIDGGCVRAAVQEICRTEFGDPAMYQPLVSSLSEGFDKVFYYDAVPGKAHGEGQAAYEARVEADHQRFAAIQALDRVHVALGNIVGPKRRQKGVDVRLAVDMMTFAFRGTISRATLFAGDADFVPLLKALVAEGLHVTLWHPSQASAELRGAADSTRLFSFRENHRCFTQDGREPAFASPSRGGGSGLYQRSDGLKGAAHGAWTYYGDWDGTKLVVTRAKPTAGHEHRTLKAPGATLERALTVFSLLSGWELPPASVAWIAQR